MPRKDDNPTPHSPRWWQRDFMRWAAPRDAVAAFMDMRLGKSLVAHRWLDSKAPCEPKLVICPNSVVHEWVKSLRGDGHEPIMLKGGASAVAEIEKSAEYAANVGAWYVMNKEGLLSRDKNGTRLRPSEVAKLPWGGVIIDESTAIRNPKAKITKVACTYLSRSPYKAVLSGLPNPEQPEDFVMQLLFLNGRVMDCRNYWEWRAKHCKPPTGGSFDWTMKPGVLAAIRKEVEGCSFILSRAEAGIKDNKVRDVVEVELPEPVMKAIRKLRKEYEVKGKMTSSALVVGTWEGMLAGGRYPHDQSLWHEAKFDAMIEYLEQNVAKGEKVVVWARYNAELFAAAARVQEHLVSDGRKRVKKGGAAFQSVPTHKDRANGSLRVAVVTGTMTRDERAKIVAKFNSGPIQFLFCQPACMDRGVDLSGASTSIVLSNYYDHEIRAQLEDRVIKVGKEQPVRIVDVVASDTVDEDVVASLADKKRESKSFASVLARGIARLSRGGSK